MYTLPTKLTFIYGVIGNAASATLLTAIAGRKQVRKADAQQAIIDLSSRTPSPEASQPQIDLATKQDDFTSASKIVAETEASMPA